MARAKRHARKFDRKAAMYGVSTIWWLDSSSSSKMIVSIERAVQKGRRVVFCSLSGSVEVGSSSKSNASGRLGVRVFETLVGTAIAMTSSAKETGDADLLLPDVEDNIEFARDDELGCGPCKTVLCGGSALLPVYAIVGSSIRLLGVLDEVDATPVLSSVSFLAGARRLSRALTFASLTSSSVNPRMLL